MFELKFDPANKSLAAAIGAALVSYGTGAELTETVGPVATQCGEPIDEPKGETVKSSVNTAGTTQTSAAASTADTAQAAGAASGAPADNTDRNNLDEKGVGKNPDFCGNAQIPFNQSGKKKGQWKKRAGVDEATYDEWYASELANVSTAGTGQGIDSPVDTGAAFGNNEKQPAAGDLTFTDAGQFMAWIAEQQAAGLLTQGDIDSAYQMTSTQVHDLFNAQLFPAAVKAVYEFLAPIAAGHA